MKFSSLSESGFIPTLCDRNKPEESSSSSSHLFQRVASFLHAGERYRRILSSWQVLISFREWLHSYNGALRCCCESFRYSSHLFQRVASFLPVSLFFLIFFIFTSVLISFREWLHSYNVRQDGRRPDERAAVLISFREWLHSYISSKEILESFKSSRSHLFQRVASFLPLQSPRFRYPAECSSHLFQRVASFLQLFSNNTSNWLVGQFSSLSESGFIPTFRPDHVAVRPDNWGSHLFQRVASFLLSNNSADWTICPAAVFSSLSESGFIPTKAQIGSADLSVYKVLISFREWLHSYNYISSYS